VKPSGLRCQVSGLVAKSDAGLLPVYEPLALQLTRAGALVLPET